MLFTCDIVPITYSIHIYCSYKSNDPEHMKPITLTTDFGYDSWFVGTMKGVIHSINSDATVIDLTHGIKAYAIREAAFTLMVNYRYFAKGAIHVIVVDPGVGGSRRPIVAVSESYIFIAPDNGVLTPVLLQETPYNVYHATNTDYFLTPVSSTFHGRDIFAPLAAHISNGIDINTIGEQINDPVMLDNFSFPDTTDSSSTLLATIIHVDHFGNLITNVPAERVTESISVSLSDNSITIARLCTSFDSVCAGKPLLVVGSSGFLEIAVNQGNASEQFHIQEGDTVRITNTT